MNYINLRYIGADRITESLANCQNMNELADIIEFKIENDLRSIDGYIQKYDNQYDKNSVNLDELKEQKQNLLDLILKLRKLDV